MFDAVVVGAGFAGMYMLHRLRGLGFSARAFEAGGGVGGTWYWNRYPGARCDVESMQYSFSFSEELDQEWNWSEKYAPQGEILTYANHVADRFDLRRHIVFDTRVTAATFDEEANCWQIETDRGDSVRAKFCIMAVGCLSAPNRPHFKGIEDFRGPVYHTGEWPHAGADFTGLRVGVIGTGSSAIQSIPIIAQQASALTVFQRTATWSVPAWNEKLSPEYLQAAKADYPALRAKARARPTGFYFLFNIKPALEASAEDRDRQYEEAWAARRPALSRRLRRSAVRKSRQRHHRRFRAPKNPRHRQGSGHRRAALSGQRVRLQAALRRYRILRDLQFAACKTGRRLEGRRSSASPPTASRSAASNIRWMPWSAPPALPR